MKNLKSVILLQRRMVQYASIAAEVVAQEGERNFQERIRKNGFHPDLKKKFDFLFPDAELKLKTPK